MTRRRSVGGDDDDWGPWPGETEWHPGVSEPGTPEVDWEPREPVGWLYAEDGETVLVEVFEPRPRFGFCTPGATE